jgi:hypothetical protein
MSWVNPHLLEDRIKALGPEPRHTSRQPTTVDHRGADRPPSSSSLLVPGEVHHSMGVIIERNDVIDIYNLDISDIHESPKRSASPASPARGACWRDASLSAAKLISARLLLMEADIIT